MSEKVVFNFLPEQYGRLALENRRLKIGLFSDLNDPFELLANKLTDREKRQRIKRRIRRLGKTVGVLCFCHSWESPVMWSHYGDKHRGICLGFAVDEELLMQVDYRKKRASEDLLPLLEGQESRNKLRTLLFGTKYEAWKYEDEVRVLVDLADVIEENGLYFRPFGEGIFLRQVIVGPRCRVGGRAVASTLSRSALSGVDVLKARLAFRSFRVVENRLGFRYSPRNNWSRVEGSQRFY